MEIICKKMSARRKEHFRHILLFELNKGVKPSDVIKIIYSVCREDPFEGNKILTNDSPSQEDHLALTKIV